MFKYIFLLSILMPCLNAHANKLIWPLDCHPGQSCFVSFGYADIKSTNLAFDCSKPGYKGHQGTDISITDAAFKKGTAVYAAADGIVQWVFDGKYDKCPSNHADCATPKYNMKPGVSDGYSVCTPSGAFCKKASGDCFWCFNGGNVIVIKHPYVKGVFATRYDHLKQNSVLVKSGQRVSQGQMIAKVGSAGKSSGPHLHFEVWRQGFYQLYDPWKGKCSAPRHKSLWKSNPPWQ